MSRRGVLIHVPTAGPRRLDDESLLLSPEIEQLADTMLGVIRQVYLEVGPGLPEAIYQEALEIAFTEIGLSFVAKPRLRVTFRGRVLRRSAEPDFLVGEHVVLELKAAEDLHARHHAQLLTYLRVARRPLGFLVNFHAPRLALGLRRKVLTM